MSRSELIIDSFAGGGGASLGILRALGRSPNLAINHNPHALAIHAANHPDTQHCTADIWSVDPKQATQGQPVGLLWASPDCRHFSKAKGSAPVSTSVRGLAWVVCEWAAAVRPRIIILENVAEFKDWGPLLKCGTPDPKSKGETFQAFTRRLRALGYTLEHQLLRANDYGAPTIRKRLFLVARCDQQPIHWPKPTHNHPQGLPARTAAECIDWSIACPSIFSRKKPLAANTLKRIAKGIARYVQGTHQPFIVTLAHGEGSGKTQRWGSGVRGLDQPLPTITASSATYGLVCAFLAQHNTMPEGGIHAGRDLLQPFSTITASGAQQQLVTAILDRAHPQQDSHLAEIIHLLSQNDLLEGSASVWIKGIQYNIVDIGMRMLAPHELAAAQGFPPNYILSQTPEGKTLSKAAQIRLIGNSVCPPVAEALVRANFEATL